MYIPIFNRDGIELLVNTETGHTYATQMAYSRMSGLTQQAVNHRCNRIQDQLVVANVESGRNQLHKLIPSNVVFSWLEDDNPSLLRSSYQTLY